MQVTTELKPLFSYSLIPILLILIIITIILSIYILKNRPKKNAIPIITPMPKDITNIKIKYLNLINNLINKVSSNSITNRKAYQELSSLIRNFIFEMTGLKVQNCTLKDIAYLNMPYLYELVNEYYDPEFAINKEGNIINSINKTKGVIEKWN